LGVVDVESAFAARLDAAGVVVWARAFPSPGSDYTRGLGVAFAGGDVVFSGFSGAPIDFGMGPTPFGSGFVVRISN
jgi:hypothetical protein